VQATDDKGEKLYVNQYGQIKPYSEVKEEITTAKTQLISLDELTQQKVSVPAKVSSSLPIDPLFDLTAGVNIRNWANASEDNAALLSDVFKLDVDNSGNPVTVDLSYLKDLNKSFTGTQLADELTNYLNREFGDEAFFDLSGQTSTLPTRDRDLTIRTSRISTTLGGVATPTPVNLTLKASDFGKTEEEMDWTQVRTRDMSAALQKAIDRTPGLRQQIGSPQVNTDGP